MAAPTNFTNKQLLEFTDSWYDPEKDDPTPLISSFAAAGAGTGAEGPSPTESVSVATRHTPSPDSAKPGEKISISIRYSELDRLLTITPTERARELNLAHLTQQPRIKLLEAPSPLPKEAQKKFTKLRRRISYDRRLHSGALNIQTEFSSTTDVYSEAFKETVIEIGKNFYRKNPTMNQIPWHFLITCPGSTIEKSNHLQSQAQKIWKDYRTEQPYDLLEIRFTKAQANVLLDNPDKKLPSLFVENIIKTGHFYFRRNGRHQKSSVVPWEKIVSIPDGDYALTDRLITWFNAFWATKAPELNRRMPG